MFVSFLWSLSNNLVVVLERPEEVFDANRKLFDEIYSINDALKMEPLKPSGGLPPGILPPGLMQPPMMPGMTMPSPGIMLPGMPQPGFPHRLPPPPGMPLMLPGMPPVPPVMPPVPPQLSLIPERKISKYREALRSPSPKRRRSRERRRRSRSRDRHRSRSRDRHRSRSRERSSRRTSSRTSSDSWRNEADKFLLSSHRTVEKAISPVITMEPVFETDMNYQFTHRDEPDSVVKLSNQIFELENVIRLKDEQLQMKDERSLIKDQTVTHLRAELNEQYITDSDRITQLSKELDEANNMQQFYESERNCSEMRTFSIHEYTFLRI